MLSKLDEWGPATACVLIIVAVAGLVGGAVVIIQPATLSFQEYLNEMKVFALAVGGLGIGRGLLAGLTNLGIAVNLPGVDPKAQPHDLTLPDQGEGSQPDAPEDHS
jgi:hypothetical protein